MSVTYNNRRRDVTVSTGIKNGANLISFLKAMNYDIKSVKESL
jgi:hypothetical protein